MTYSSSENTVTNFCWKFTCEYKTLVMIMSHSLLSGCYFCHKDLTIKFLNLGPGNQRYVWDRSNPESVEIDFMWWKNCKPMLKCFICLPYCMYYCQLLLRIKYSPKAIHFVSRVSYKSNDLWDMFFIWHSIIWVAQSFLPWSSKIQDFYLYPLLICGHGKQ